LLSVMLMGTGVISTGTLEKFAACGTGGRPPKVRYPPGPVKSVSGVLSKAILK
jgi:hypothetical protein